jgi:putative NADH-flavin reductase
VNIALFGASGTIGQRILKEALSRGHQVTVVARNTSRIDGIPAVKGDVLEAARTYFSPAISIEPGDRTGKYRVGGDEVLMDAKGQSRISAEDYAVAMLDEVEKPKLHRRRVTIAY